MRELIEAIAVPRQHGTKAAATVESRIRRELEDRGLSIESLPFAFSDWPGRWGVPAAGVALLAILLLATMLCRRGLFATATLVLIAPAVAAALFVAVADRIILDLPWSRRAGRNLLARRGEVTPRIIVVAHRDTKSQGVPLAARVGGVLLAATAWLTLTLNAMMDGMLLRGPILPAAATLGAIGSIALIACGVGNASAGALDNASGVLGLLQIAERVTDPSVAFLVTDAEELGLAGSRAIARQFEAVDAIVNLDGLDDRGPVVVIEGRLPWRSRVPGPVAAGILESARAGGLAAQRRGLPPGLLTDHVAFARVGIPSLTVLRGTIASLTRVHSKKDDLRALTGTGAIEVGNVVSDALARVARPGSIH